MATIAKVANCGRLQPLRVTEVVGVTFSQRRNKSTEVTHVNYKKGTGGRSSFSGIVATVFGATGFTGRPVVNKFGKIGSQVIVPYRGDPYEIKDIPLAGDLGQILFNKFHLQDEESIRKCVQYSNVVVNLIGRDYETKNFSFEDVHVDGARRLARIAKESGVKKFIHVSALNAGVESEILLKGGSRYLASKLAGEQAVREEFPEATILRPASIVGMADKFVFYLNSDSRYLRAFNLWAEPVPVAKIFPLWKHGHETTKVPLKLSDFTKGVMAALHNPDAAGKTYQMYGPQAYTLYELVSFIHRCRRLDCAIDHYSFYAMKQKVKALEAVYNKFGLPLPRVTMDRLEQEIINDQIMPDLPTIEDLGIVPENVENYISYLLKPWTMGKYHHEEIGEVIKPEKPKPSYSTLAFAT